MRVGAAVLVAALATLPAAAAPAPSKPTKSGQPAQPSAPKSGKSADDKSQPVTIDADRMERLGREGLVIFTGAVVARQNNSVQYADRMEVYFDEGGDRILRTVSTGSVKIITRDCRTGTAKRAEYFDFDQRLVLSGGARVWQDENVVTGEVITIFLSQDRSVVEGGKQGRVKGVFYQKHETQKPDAQRDDKARDDKSREKEAAKKKDAAPTCVN